MHSHGISWTHCWKNHNWAHSWAKVSVSCMTLHDTFHLPGPGGPSTMFHDTLSPKVSSLPMAHYYLCLVICAQGTTIQQLSSTRLPAFCRHCQDPITESTIVAYYTWTNKWLACWKCENVATSLGDQGVVFHIASFWHRFSFVLLLATSLSCTSSFYVSITST